MARPPFDLIRAAFYLLAFVIGIALLESVFGLVECAYIAIAVRVPGEGCQTLGSQIHEVISEFLTAVLALLLAARSDKPPPPPDP